MSMEILVPKQKMYRCTIYVEAARKLSVRLDGDKWRQSELQLPWHSNYTSIYYNILFSYLCLRLNQRLFMLAYRLWSVVERERWTITQTHKGEEQFRSTETVHVESEKDYCGQ